GHRRAARSHPRPPATPPPPGPPPGGPPRATGPRSWPFPVSVVPPPPLYAGPPPFLKVSMPHPLRRRVRIFPSLAFVGVVLVPRCRRNVRRAGYQPSSWSSSPSSSPTRKPCQTTPGLSV